MSLFSDLQKCKTEEDVKDCYIKALHLKSYQKNLIDTKLEKLDSLIPLDERSFKGAYYTPLKVVEKAYELLTRVLGAGWQRESRKDKDVFIYARLWQS